jgi:hypothetical protein
MSGQPFPFQAREAQSVSTYTLGAISLANFARREPPTATAARVCPKATAIGNSP